MKTNIRKPVKTHTHSSKKNEKDTAEEDEEEEIFPTGSPATNWSQSTHATPNCKPGQTKRCWNSRFVDSGRALIIGGRRGFWTKGVEGGLIF